MTYYIFGTIDVDDDNKDIEFHHIGDIQILNTEDEAEDFMIDNDYDTYLSYNSVIDYMNDGYETNIKKLYINDSSRLIIWMKGFCKHCDEYIEYIYNTEMICYDCEENKKKKRTKPTMCKCCNWGDSAPGEKN